MASDTRYVYGASCTWHGPITAIGTKRVRLDHEARTLAPVHGIPCCPHCSGMLFEYSNKAIWDANVAKADAQYPGYADFVAWLGSYGRCWPGWKLAGPMYKEATGKDLPL